MYFRMRRYARNAAGRVDLFRFDIEDITYIVFLTGGHNSTSEIGNRSPMSWRVDGLKKQWGLSQFKDQRIKPEQKREAIRRVWTAEINDEV